MELFCASGGPLANLFSPRSCLGLLLLAVAQTLLSANGQQVGVSLMLRGEVLPNDSFVDLGDILFTGPSGSANPPSNRNPRSSEALTCVTDLVDCCGTESGTVRTVRGDWYPDVVTLSGGSGQFRVNRGPNEVIDGSQVYGSVRLYRHYTPPQRGRYRCELPNADDPSVNQTLYANILDFGFRFDVDQVTISPSTGSATAGEAYSLTCSSTLFDPSRLPFGLPSPNFQWSFNGGASLPSGVTATPTVRSSYNDTSETYSSTLTFSSISQCHAGMYTCRLGAGRLVNSAMVAVNGLSVQITISGAKTLGQSDYSLTCDVTGAENTSISYQWTKNNGTHTQVQVGTDRVLSFSPLRVSDAGQYTCQATDIVSLCNINKVESHTHDVTLGIPTPTSVTLSSSIPNPIPPFGSDVTLTCTVTVESNPAVDVPVTVNTKLFNPGGFMHASTAQPVMGSIVNYTTAHMISPFSRSDSGSYTCSATVSLTSGSDAYIRDSNTVSPMDRVTTGVYLARRGIQITNNSNINIRNIGQTSDNPNGALQCVTDNLRCCRQNGGLGKWYLPNGALVQGTISMAAFYRSRGDNGEVFLNRPSGVESPTGLFCCKVPDATNTNRTLCVNIGLSVTASGSSVAGDSYTLECSAGGSNVERFQWLGPPDGMTPVVENSPRLNIISNATSSQLQFRPVQQSDNGSYSCNATVDGSELRSDVLNVVINAPVVSVNISDGGGTPTVGGNNYRLTCGVSGAENLNPAISYQWTKNSGSGQIQVGTNSSIFSFTPLQLSDAASYVCEVNISSSYLSGDIVTMSINSHNVSIQIPTPSSLMLRSNLETVLFGSDVTLTCTLGLNSAIVTSDVPLLMVEAQLSRNGILLGNLTLSSMTGTTFTYTTLLSSFSLSNVGNYTCNATVRPQPSSTYISGNEALESDTVPVTTGVYLSLNDRLFTNNSDVSVTDIGGVGEALLCFTDNAQCCNDTGRWFKQGGGDVGDVNGDGDLYVSRGLSVVRLHRKNNTFPSGVYCCEVPDARSLNIRTCANIVLQPSTTTESPPGPSEPSPQQGVDPAIVGGVVAGLAVLILLVVIIIVVVIFLRRRSSGKPYEVSKTKASVLYSRQTNGDQVIGVGINKGPKIVDFPSDTSITEGEGVHFKIKVSGEPQPTVTWYHDGEPIRADYAREIESDGSLAIPSAELKHSGVYKAVAANKHGSEEREIKLTVSEEGAESKADIGETVKSRPVPIPEFGKYVSDLHSNSNKPFKDLYEALDRGEQGHSTGYATESHRKPLNRFGNIIVYDDNRIVLQPLPEYKDCQGDYINACYIDGYSVPNKFIATQGPIPKTVVDFWRLIWQERPPTIVMVTNIKEGNKIKCQQYWPTSGQESYGPFQVIISDQQIFADYTVRTLSVSLGSGGRSHKVTQYHFTAWPDHGVPDYATPILAFHRRVKGQHHPSRGPMIVHCSAGVGRTGTFIVIDNILEQIEKEQVVDIPGAVTKIRQRRMKMVQTHEQFTFIHDAILESVTCGDTQISATNLRSAIMKLGKKDGFQHQMKVLEQVSPNPDEVQCNTARGHSNKNRGEQYLPADRWRVILKGEQPDYIHAVSINGYKHQRAFIIAQGPLQSTVRNFWKMIYDRKCAVIVMLSDLVEGGQEASAQYWPTSGIDQYGEYTVDLLGEEPLQGFTIRTLSVLDKKTQKAHQVTQFHITCWRPDGHCSNLKSVTDVIEEMTKVQIRSGNKPIVVHCSDTVTRSGMFCAIATTIERCKTEGVVDVFQVVKALRVQKPGAVPTVEEYQQIFQTVLVFLESFDTYANFQM